MNGLNELKNVKRLGVMGGSFNPPHVGHFLMAETAMEALKLDKVLFIPTGKIVYKQENDRASGTDRYKMLKTVVSRNPGFCITDMEISQDEITYTANTLTRLKEKLPDTELFFIVGADSLGYMDKWCNPQVIFELCTVAAMKRSAIPDERFLSKAEYLKNNFSADIRIVDMPYVDISSTELRERIRDGRSIRYLCDEEIIDYILKNKLYKKSKPEVSENDGQ